MRMAKKTLNASHSKIVNWITAGVSRIITSVNQALPKSAPAMTKQQQLPELRQIGNSTFKGLPYRFRQRVE